MKEEESQRGFFYDSPASNIVDSHYIFKWFCDSHLEGERPKQFSVRDIKGRVYSSVDFVSALYSLHDEF